MVAAVLILLDAHVTGCGAGRLMLRSEEILEWPLVPVIQNARHQVRDLRNSLGIRIGQTSTETGAVDQRIRDLQDGATRADARLEGFELVRSDVQLEGGSLDQHMRRADAGSPGRD